MLTADFKVNPLLPIEQRVLLAKQKETVQTLPLSTSTHHFVHVPLLATLSCNYHNPCESFSSATVLKTFP